MLMKSKMNTKYYYKCSGQNLFSSLHVYPSRMFYIILFFYKSKVLQTKPIHHQQIFISAHINRYVTLASLCPLNWTWMIANSSRLLLQKRKAYSGYKGFIETGRDQKIDQQKEAIYLSEDKWMSRDVVQQRQLCRQQSIHLWNCPERIAPLANSSAFSSSTSILPPRLLLLTEHDLKREKHRYIEK